MRHAEEVAMLETISAYTAQLLQESILGFYLDKSVVLKCKMLLEKLLDPDT